MPKFAFRKARYPLLIETDGGVKGAINGAQLSRVIKKARLKKDSYQVIDSTGEGWIYYTEMDVVSPLVVDKQWSKNRIIEFYNSYKQSMKEPTFVGRSLSNKRLEKVIGEIIEFDNQALTKQ